MKLLPSYSHIRGFNYQPSYGSHGLEIWGDSFDASVFDREVALGKAHFPGINTIRLWLSHDAFIRYGERTARNVDAALDAVTKHDVKVIVTLFNGWHSYPDFGGIVAEQIRWFGTEGFDLFDAYLDAIVRPHATDERILLWDLCNEPFNNARGCQNSLEAILAWLTNVYDACRAYDPDAPICVGQIPNLESIRQVEPISDVITFHPYFACNAWVPTARDFTDHLDEVVAFAKSVGKSLAATETCWGSLDDARRCETLAVELGELAKRGIGFTAHLLHHTLVADGHLPEFGPVTAAGYMAFINPDGSIRPGHEIFNTF